MMVDCVVGEGLLSHQICNVQTLLSARSLRGLREGSADAMEVCLALLRIPERHAASLAELFLGCPRTGPGSITKTEERAFTLRQVEDGLHRRIVPWRRTEGHPRRAAGCAQGRRRGHLPVPTELGCANGRDSDGGFWHPGGSVRAFP